MEELKTLPGPFQAVWDGIKTYEIRKADRPFRLWTVLHLREWDGKKYTGRSIAANIKYITPPGEFGLGNDVVVLGIHVYQRVDPKDPDSKTPRV